MHVTYAEVYVELKHRRMDRTFDYRVPSALKDKVAVGSRVLVPFGSATYQGYVVHLHGQAQVDKVKDITDVLETQPIFSPQDIELARWMAEHYLCPFVSALECMLPVGLKYEGRTVVTLTTGEEEQLGGLVNSLQFFNPDAAKLLQLLLEKTTLTRKELEKGWCGENIDETLQVLKSMGVVQEQKQFVSDRMPQETVAVIAPGREADLKRFTVVMSGRAPKQAEIASLLLAEQTVPVKQILKRCRCTREPVKGLESKGLIRFEDRLALPEITEHRSGSGSLRQLTVRQQQVLQKVETGLAQEQFASFLLHGVTGSGKTEIYLRAAALALEQGRQAMVLVPEISLTPQMVQRFTARFHQRVAVLHSALTRTERLRQWLKVRQGEADVVLGARSAVFAPVSKLGLIVIDEEHESSYKQEQAPKYHAREVAEMRARQHGAVLLLGSATPALESFQKAQARRYKLLTMDQRVQGSPLPAVAVVDMRQERRQGNMGIFSTALFQSLEQCIGNGEQAILFLNRRGYSSFLICEKCGLSVRCPHCDIALTHHTAGNKLMCHYCGYRQPPLSKCSRCGSPHVSGVGCGTQQVEREMQVRFPDTAIIRMDADTTRRRGSHRRLLESFGRGKGQVLIGTQMIAKGLDFANVTLVGVVSADTGLNIPDFRAWERTFQLLTQVAGRAGRGDRSGRVVIQTFDPENPAVQFAKQHDYLGFYRQELKRRREYGYPPYCHLIRLLITGDDQNKVTEEIQHLAGRINKRIGSIAGELLGPAPAPVSKMKGKYRWHLVLKSPELSQLKRLVNETVREHCQDFNSAGNSLTIDVNPMGMI